MRSDTRIQLGLAALVMLATVAMTAHQRDPLTTDQAALRVSPPAPSVLTLLGTNGGPGGSATRAGVATLVTVNGTGYLFDAGEAVVFQAAKAGNPNIARVFLTHLHSDHTAGLFSLAMFRRNLAVYGPPRTDAFVKTLADAIVFDTDVRGAEGSARAENTAREARGAAGAREGTNGGGEAAGRGGRAGGAGGRGGGAAANASRGAGVPAPVGLTGTVVVPGVVYRDANVTVEALENSHFNVLTGAAANLHKSYSYKITTPDRTFVITGDTGWSDALVKFSAGADILVAEMVSPTQLTSGPNTAILGNRHLFPVDIGRMAAQAKIKMIVATHLRTSLADDMAEMRRICNCQVVLGEDLMKF